MRIIVLILLCLVSFSSNAQSKYSVLQKFKFHSLEFVETETDKPLDSFPEGQGLVINCEVEGKEYLLISIPSIHDYNITVVNKVTDTPEKDIKVVMYQGGEKIESLGTYTCNVFYVYDLSKNQTTPEFIRFAINGSPNIQIFKGLIKLED